MSRFNFIQWDERSSEYSEKLKSQIQEVEYFINVLPEGRAKALALTKLEECFMWAGKAIRDAQLQREGGNVDSK